MVGRKNWRPKPRFNLEKAPRYSFSFLREQPEFPGAYLYGLTSTHPIRGKFVNRLIAISREPEFSLLNSPKVEGPAEVHREELHSGWHVVIYDISTHKLGAPKWVNTLSNRDQIARELTLNTARIEALKAKRIAKIAMR